MKRIAIYSRKSIFTGKGESIENQISLCKKHCENYMNKDIFIFKIYEDEGFSGKNTNRPKFKKLIQDIKNKNIDILICYRLDRISRNVSDFSQTLELLQKYNVTFISIKEQFDTSTPMGRAMIYIASVFAQLERETIAERVRDNMCELAKMGKWSGGQLPFGFTSDKYIESNKEMKDKKFVKLIPLNTELKIVKFIYENYISKESISYIVKILNEKSIKGKNGACFDNSIIRKILKNPLYVKSNNKTHSYLESKGINVYGEANGNGYLTYNKYNKTKNQWIAAISNHTGIIDSDKWLKVQYLIDKRSNNYTSNRSGTGNNTALFAGILKCKKCNTPMVIKYNSKNKYGKSYIYYVCKNKSKCKCPSLRTDIIDEKLLNEINIFNKENIINIFNKNFKTKDTNKNLKNKILKKEGQIHNLVLQLSNTSNKGLSEILLNEINILNDEILDIKSSQNIDIHEFKENEIDIEKLTSYFKNFYKYINSIEDLNFKKLVIRKLVKEIIFDSNINSFYIKLKST